MIHLGDITKINGAIAPIVDVITGGSPCQDLSVAGKRAGLDGARSGLFMEQIRIVKEMRKKYAETHGADEPVRPRYMVWENVPGAFSSNRGKDFQAVLTEIVRIAEPDAVNVPLFGGGKRWSKAGVLMGIGANGQPFSVAYRVHDAQFWGVPQRRKRIALVADFGGLTAPEILFERKGLPGDSEPRETQRKGTAENAVGCADKASISFQERAGKPGGGKGILIQDERTGALSTLNNQSVCCLNDQGGSMMSVSEDVAGCLRASEHGHQPSVLGLNRERCGAVVGNDIMPTMQAAAGESGNNKPMVCAGFKAGQSMAGSIGWEEEKAATLSANCSGTEPTVYDGSQVTCPTNSVNPKQGDPCHTLHADSRNLLINQTICIEGNGMRNSHNGDGFKESETMYTLNTVEHHAVAVLENNAQDSRMKISKNGVFQTLSAKMGMGGGNTPMVLDQAMCKSENCTMQGLGVYAGVAAPLVTAGVHGVCWDGSQTSPTLTANNAGGNQRMPDKENFNCVCQSLETYHCNTEDEKAPVLKARDYKDPPCVYGLDRAAFNQGANAQYKFSVEEEKIGAQVARGPGAVCAAVDCRNGTENPDVNGTLQAKESGGISCNCNNVCRTNAIVRRLTPMECERLQGFPDRWTDIGEWVDSKGKKHKDADSPRYKALGNSIALPFWQWMADRMCKQYDRPVEMASLFDGIGGFPLVFKRAGGNPVWASEIEEFPIAVTKRRFPET